MKRFLNLLKIVVTLYCCLSSTMAQNVVYTSGYSNKINTYILDTETGEADTFGDQTVEDNMTWIVLAKDGKTFYSVHEVDAYEGFGNTGAVSLWDINRDGNGAPVFEKRQVSKDTSADL